MKTRTFDAHISAKIILEKLDQKNGQKLKQSYLDILDNTIKKAEANGYNITRETIKNLLFKVLESEFVGFTVPAKHRNEQKNWNADLNKKLK
ncbi:MAG TPA: hypothetical protein ENJ27_02295 [Candidatus Moranbacteria bacterium]|nr:hypothetical protein [Candidatus Moranbacteria bacterium]